jgi:hypothetical protein
MKGFSSSQRAILPAAEVNRRGMSPQPTKSPAKCGVTRGGNWSALHPCAPYIERTVLGRMIAPPDHLTIRPNPACRIGFAGLNPSCKLTTRPARVICPSGGLLTGVSSLISDFPKDISAPTHPKRLDGLLRCARNDDLLLCVVLAKAGTHNPRRVWLRKVFASVPHRDDTAYGSQRSPGRR